MTDLPALDPAFVDRPTLAELAPGRVSTHPPRFLLLYGSLRERSYSRLLIEEADRLLRRFGGETRIFDPRGLPQPDDAPDDHPKVKELRDLSAWSEGHVWCSPERHGTITGISNPRLTGCRWKAGASDPPRAGPWPSAR